MGNKPVDKIFPFRREGGVVDSASTCYHCIVPINIPGNVLLQDVLRLHTTIIMAATSLDLLYSQIDVFPTFTPPQPEPAAPKVVAEQSLQLHGLMKELVSAQDRQTSLMEELAGVIVHSHRRRFIELGLWKKNHPELAEYCKRAAKKLERIQTDLLSTITEEIESNADVLLDSEFGLNEFVDRFGTKFLQLNSLLQILTHLGNAPDIQVVSQEIQQDK